MKLFTKQSLAMNATFVHTISQACTSAPTLGMSKIEVMYLEQVLFLLVGFLYTCFNPAARFADNCCPALLLPVKSSFKQLSAGTHFR